MVRTVQVLGYIVLLLAVVGEISFIGLAPPIFGVCGLAPICSAQSCTTGGVPTSIYDSFVIWNSFSYTVLALVGIALVLLDAREKKA